MDFNIVLAFNSDQMIDAIEKTTGKIVDRTRVDLLAGLVAMIQSSIKDSDPKYFLGGMMMMGWDNLFQELPGHDDLFLEV